MGQCKVAVELDRLQYGGGPIPCGDLVRGVVVVEVEEEVEARNLMVELRWTVRGRGFSVDRTSAKATLPGARLEPGSPARLPFEIRVPENAPASYRGELFELSWQLHARVGLPMSASDLVVVDLVVGPGPRSEPFRDEPPSVAKSFWGSANGLLALTSIPPAMLGVLLFFLGTSSDWPTIAATVAYYSMPALLMLSLMLGRKVQARVRARLPRVTLGFVPMRVAPGGEVEVRFALPKMLAGRLRSARCHLVGEELVVTGSGKRPTTLRHKLFETEVPLSTQGPGPAPTWHGHARLPENAASTLVVPGNRVQWRAMVRVDLEGLVAQTWEQELEVDLVRPGASA